MNEPTTEKQTVGSGRKRRRLVILALVALILAGAGYLTLRDRDPYVPPKVVKRPDRKTGEPAHPLDQALDIAYERKAYMVKAVQDYTATLVKRERIGGKLGEPSTLFVKIRSRQRDKDTEEITRPMSVYLRFLEPSSLKGREVIWVEGKNKNKLIAHEAGFKNFFRAKLAPTSMLAMMGNRYPITEIGIENLLDKLIMRGEAGRKFTDTQVTVTKDVAFKGYVCTVIEVVHPEKGEEFSFHVARIHLDQKLGLPINYASYSWPAEKGGDLPLEEEYSYKDIKLNVGLTDMDFDPDNPDYDYPGKKKKR